MKPCTAAGCDRRATRRSMCSLHYQRWKVHGDPTVTLLPRRSNADHHLLHIRTEALDATGNANARKCKYCHIYDVPENLAVIRDGRVYHAACNRLHVAKFTERRRGASA